MKSPTTRTKPLLRCSRCQVAWYCSAACQREHYAEKHRVICMNITKAKKRVEQEKHKLLLSNPENVFETETGNFWGMPEMKAYMKATFALAEAYTAAASACDVKEVWEKALFHFLEHLRLGAPDCMGARFRTPFFLLLNLHRDDDACNFIDYSMQIGNMIELNPDEIFDVHFYTYERRGLDLSSCH